MYRLLVLQDYTTLEDLSGDYIGILFLLVLIVIPFIIHPLVKNKTWK